MTSVTPTNLATEAGDSQVDSPADQLLDEIDALLEAMRERHDEIPQWEFCEGFMAALICCRRAIAANDYFYVLLDEPSMLEADDFVDGCFDSAEQKQRFLAMWNQRWSEVQTALDTPVQSLEDPAAYMPQVIDLRAAVASLAPQERAEWDGKFLPALGQVWALGFMFAVETWPEDWEPPRDKKLAKGLDACMQALVDLTADDLDEPDVPALDGQAPATISRARLEVLAQAIWAVYDLREMWRSIGPRIAPTIRTATPGRNDPCSCGSGKKYKKCCGA
jgi:uncharacterized protein